MSATPTAVNGGLGSDGMTATNGVGSVRSSDGDELMAHVIEHLRCRGMTQTLDSLHRELGLHPKSTSNGASARKRTFSEMAECAAVLGSEGASATSYLTRMYEHFQSRGPSASAAGATTMEEQVMSALDLSLESFGKYEAVFAHSNKSHVSCISFSSDGSCTAVGGVDGTVRVLSVSKLHQSSNFNLIKKYDAAPYSELHRPVICTLSSGATERVHEVDFCPNEERRHLVSCFEGGVHLFEFGPTKSRREPLVTINECFAVRTAQFHPAGDHVLSAGRSCWVRLYDLRKEQGFIARDCAASDVDLNQVRWGTAGAVFASCSAGGDIRLYDGRTLSTLNTLRRAHSGRPVTSIRFSADCKYLLSSGYDDVLRLTDLRMGRECVRYRDCRNRVDAAQPQQFQGCFTFNDEHVVAYSNVANRIFVFDANSGHRIARFRDHAASSSRNEIAYLATSPTEPAFMCSTTGDAKNWFFAPIKSISALGELSPSGAEEEGARSQNGQSAADLIGGGSGGGGALQSDATEHDPLAALK